MVAIEEISGDFDRVIVRWNARITVIFATFVERKNYVVQFRDVLRRKRLVCRAVVNHINIQHK